MRKASEFAAELMLPGDDDKTKNCFELFFDLVDAGFNVQGLIGALEGLKATLEAGVNKFGFDNQFAGEIQTAFAIFESRVRNRQEKYGGKPIQNKNIIIYFLSERRNQILKLPDGVVRLQKLGLIGYLAHRAALTSSIESQRKLWDERNNASTSADSFIPIHDHQPQEAARALIKVLLCLSLEAQNQEVPINLSETAVEQAMNAALNTGKSFYSSYGDYLRWAKTLFAGKHLNRHHVKPPSDQPSVRKSGSSARKDAALPQVLTEEQRRQQQTNFDRLYQEYERANPKTERDIAREKELKRWKLDALRQISDGSAPDELTPSPKQSEIRSMRAGFASRGRSQRVSGWTPPWDKTVITQEMLGVLLAHLYNEVLSDADAPDHSSASQLVARQLLIFVAVQICFGFAPHFLIDARVAEQQTEPTPTDETPLIYNAGHFYIKPRKYDGKPLFGTGDEMLADIYRLGGHTLKVPVAPFLKNLIEQHIKSAPPGTGHLFFSVNAAGESTQLKINNFDQPLSVAAMRLRENLNPSAIARSAAIHLIAAGRLDDVLAVLIRGYVPRLWGAQGHYDHFSSSFLAKSYNAAQQLGWTRTKDKSRQLTALLNLPSLTDFKNYCSSLAASQRPPASLDSSAALLMTGSSSVPVTTKLSGYLTHLKSLAETAAAPISRFNCATAFSALSLMALTGIRATEAQSLTGKSFYAENGEATLAIKGKPNRYFDEWRFSFLPAPFGEKLLLDYLSRAAEIKKYLVNEAGAYPARILAEQNNSLFFFVNDSGRIVPLTSKNLKRKLHQEIPAEYANVSFCWKINSLRHLFATTALELRIPRPLIDSLSGHTTRGREPLSPYSFVPANKIKSTAAQVAQQIATRLNLFQI